MNDSSFTTIERKHTSLNEQMLVIDKGGVIGGLLVQEVAKQATVVFVTGYIHPLLTLKKHVVILPYKKRVPAIPHAAYSHMIVVYNGERSQLEFAKAIHKEARLQKAIFVLVVDQKLATFQVISELVSIGTDVRIAIVGDLFGNPLLFGSFGSIDHVLGEAKNSGDVSLSGMGLTPFFPVLVEDAVQGILQVAFAQHTTGQVFFVYPKQSYSMLSIAHMLQKIDPLIRVDFINGHTKEPQKIKGDALGEYVLGLKYPIFEKIKIAWNRLEKKQIVHQRKQHIKKEKLFLRHVRWFVLMLACLLLLPLIGTGFFSLAGGYELQRTKQALVLGNLQGVLEHGARAMRFFQIAAPFSEVLAIEVSPIGKGSDAQALHKAIIVGRDAATAITRAVIAAERFLEIVEGKAKDPKNATIKATEELKEALLLLQQWQAENSEYLEKNPFLPSSFTSAVKNEQMTKGAKTLTSLLSVLPSILGIDGTKKYLVIFQNNMELRPGGGFIGSYGVLTLVNGKITDLAIHDVYDADGQLKGHIEPPFAIRRHLPLVHWYLRDSNFDIDFGNVATTSAFFLNAETGEKVDGVIGVDVAFVEKLLWAIGSVYVSDYKETVDADNIYTLTQSHAEKDFFPGSTQKKDFLRSLSLAIIAKFQDASKIPYLPLMNAVQESIAQKHVLFGFTDSSLQALFIANNLSSSVKKDAAQSPNTVSDFLGLSEANLGANKVNYFIRRKVDYNVAIDDLGRVTGTLTIKYANESKKNSLYEGDYKNYLRVIVPMDTRLISLAIDGVTQDIVRAVTDPSVYEKEKFSPPPGLEVEEVVQDGKTIVGFLVVIPKASVLTITLTYILPEALNTNVPSPLYQLSFFKQPGTAPYTFSMSLSYPLPFLLQTTPKAMLVKKSENTFTLSDVLTGDRTFDFSFAAK